MNTPATEIAYAKLNLALHVRRRRGDGYHDIETVFAFCEDGDRITATPASATSLTITGPFAECLSLQDNLVSEAAGMFNRPVALVLDKRLPVASGVGGGSADAAATLRLLARLFDALLPALAAQQALGADVPACVVSATRRGDGTGAILSDEPPVTGMPVLLINPCIPLSTAAVFAAWDGVDRGPLGAWRTGRNDLETPAQTLVPEIAGLLGWLARREGVTLIRMSGSGATCFALFANAPARAAAAAAARAAFPDYWSMESTLR